MVRADVFNGFFCGFDRCGSAAFSGSCPPKFSERKFRPGERGDFLAAALLRLSATDGQAGGEMSSDYFKNGAPLRKSQRVLVRLASLGD